MPGFQFRLQQYLGIKEQIEDQKELAYAKALQMLQAEKVRLQSFIDQRLNTINAMRDALMQIIDPVEIRRMNNVIERLNYNIIVQKERVRAAEEFTEAKRQELVEAMKERKALEIVKDSALEEHLHENGLTERKQIDELISFKHTVKGVHLD